MGDKLMDFGDLINFFSRNYATDTRHYMHVFLHNACLTLCTLTLHIVIIVITIMISHHISLAYKH